MRKNERFMHVNDMSMHEKENFVSRIIFSHRKMSWVVGLYTTSCMESSPMKTYLGQQFYVHAWKFHFPGWKFDFYA